MKLTVLILLLTMGRSSLSAQYYFTGEVKDPHGDKLQNVSIRVRSTGLVFRTGIYGDFGIISRKADDTLSFLFDGYESYTTSAKATEFLQISLQTLPFQAPGSGNLSLVSVFREMRKAPPRSDSANAFLAAGGPLPDSGTQTIVGPDSIHGVSISEPPGQVFYNSMVENGFVRQAASVSFPGNFSGGSFGMVRRFLDMGTTVPPEAVKIEEMLNYFNFYYEDPEKNNVFQCASDLFSCPWDRTHRLLYLNICARKVDLGKAPAANLVFLIDASGSMDMPGKLPLIKSGLRLLVKNLRDIDTVSLVVYGRNTGVVLAGAGGLEKGKITRAIEGLTADGPTPGEEGIRLAYQVAQRQFMQNGNNRIVLITDGDICEGPAAEKGLEEMVEQQDQAGIHLSCMGVGMKDFSDSRLPVLAQKGHGNFSLLDEEQGAEKLLVNELAPTLCSVAENVYITAGFDSVLVKEYRLIGFSNKKSVVDDTAFRLQGSPVGSGHSLLALFELVPKKDSAEIKTIGVIKISYSLPGQGAIKTMDYDCPNHPVTFDRAGASQRRAACIALFAMKLQRSAFASQISWMDLEKMAKKNFAGSDFVDREYMAMVTRARKIYEHKR